MQHQRGASPCARPCQPGKAPLARSTHSTICCPSLPLRVCKGPGSANHSYLRIPRAAAFLQDAFAGALSKEKAVQNAEGRGAACTALRDSGETANPSSPVPQSLQPGHKLFPVHPWLPPRERGFPLSRAFLNHGVQHPAVCPSRLSAVSHSVITRLLLLHLPLQVRFSGPSKHARLAGSPHLESRDPLAFQRVIIEL